MAKCIKFIDVVNLQPVSSIKEDDLLHMTDWLSSNPSTNSVTVKLKATHAGRITLNNSMYLPDRVRSGVGSWLSPFPKPILLHHPEKSSLFGPGASGKARDPVGRVVEARYVDISQGVPRYDSLKDEHNYNQFLDLAKGTKSFEDSCMIAKMLIIDNDQLMNDPSYEGLGYIELTASISDPDAVRKVLDGRYLTGSISAHTNKAVCSICQNDWATEDGMCDHRPGKVYDGKRCVLIAGDLSYTEYSFVNSPADEFSGIIEVQNSTESEYFIPNLSVIPQDQSVAGPFTLEEAHSIFGQKRQIFDLFVEKRENIKQEENIMSEETVVESTTPEVLEGPPAPEELQDSTPAPETVEPVEQTPEVTPVPVQEDSVQEDSSKELVEKIKALVESIPSSSTLDALNDEIQGLKDDNLMLQEALATAISSERDAKLSKLSLLSCISTKNPNIKEVSEGFAAKTLEEIDVELKKVEELLQDNYLHVMLTNSTGMTNDNPEGKVSDPTINISDTPARSEVMQQKRVQVILDKYEEIRTFNGQTAADEFLQLHLNKNQLSQKEE